MNIDYLSPQEVADRLSIKRRTVYAWIAQGKMPAVKLSRSLTRIPVQALRDFIAAKEQASVS